MKPLNSIVVKSALLTSAAALFSSCATSGGGGNKITHHGHHQVVVGVREQQLAVLDQGRVERVYPISTSKFGLGTRPNSYATPLGRMVIANKIGDRVPVGGVFKGRKFTGEVARPNTGRDPIITRILTLNGVEPQNANTAARAIYIHGTPAENMIGRPASYGCVRMKSYDLLDLYSRVGVGTPVMITPNSWTSMVPRNAPPRPM